MKVIEPVVSEYIFVTAANGFEMCIVPDQEMLPLPDPIFLLVVNPVAITFCNYKRYEIFSAMLENVAYTGKECIPVRQAIAREINPHQVRC